MKVITKLSHWLVYVSRLEFLFLWLSKIHPFFLKFVPLHFTYQMDDKRKVERNGVIFNLNLSDYMQWHIFAKQPDLSWHEAQKFVDEECCILDVGANCGAFSLRVAQKAESEHYQNFKVYAFEPNPFIFHNLEQNLLANPKLISYVELEQVGVGAEPGFLEMTFDKRNTGHAHITQGTDEPTFQIPITTVDRFVKERVRGKISFIKIDVEGYEPLVLQGARETIIRFKPALFIEITEKWFQERGYSQNTIFTDLASIGYRLYAEGREEWQELEDCTSVVSVDQFNLLAIYG